MAKTLRNTILTLMAAGAFLLPQKADAQNQVNVAAGGQDTVWAKTLDGQDSAKVIYFSKDGTSELGALEVNGVLYIAVTPYDSLTHFNTRKVNGQNYGYNMEVSDVQDGSIGIALVGRTNNPAPEPVGKEYLFKGQGDTLTINGNKIRFIGPGANNDIYCYVNNDTTKIVGLKPNEWTTIGGKNYTTNFSFGDGKPNGFVFGRVVADEPSTVIQKRNTPYRIVPTNGIGKIFDVSGRLIYSGPNVYDVVKKVTSQNHSGAYVVRMPNSQTSLERKIK